MNGAFRCACVGRASLGVAGSSYCKRRGVVRGWTFFPPIASYIITDVRTVVGADPRYCADAPISPGHGALWGAMRKNLAMLDHTISQGDAFYALYHEAGGRMGDSAYDFLGMIIDSAGGSASDRMAFKVYALQRLHAANFCGVAAVINSRPVIRTGPGVPPGFGLQPLGPPALSPPSALEASGASRARPLPQPQITTTTPRRCASHRARKGLVCCCPIA